jgi:anti-repressor protein
MEALVKVENNQIVTDSRSVAEHFGKQHKNVLQTIENLAAENPATKFLFQKTTFENRGKQYPMYLMNRDGFSLLVMGFTGTKALEWKLKYIEAFNAMERKLKEATYDSYMISDPVERAKKWIEEEKERQKLRAENKVMLPKADFYDTVANTESLFSMADVAKTLDMGIGRNKLFAFLRDKGILDKDNHPYQKYVDAGYLRLIENHCKAGDNDVVYKCTYVKQRGIDYIRKILLRERGLNESMG